jgi:hypothetical protein
LPQPQQQHQQEGANDDDDDDDDDDYKNLARRWLQRERAAFIATVEDEASLALSARCLAAAPEQLPAPTAAGDDDCDGGLWLDRRQRRARENERIVKKLFEQQRKRRLTAT